MSDLWYYAECDSTNGPKYGAARCDHKQQKCASGVKVIHGNLLVGNC
jgi:hypothetical protein